VNLVTITNVLFTRLIISNNIYGEDKLFSDIRFSIPSAVLSEFLVQICWHF